MPERRPQLLEVHGDRRVDDWFWLRDRDDPAVRAHLEAENAYAEAVLAPLSSLHQALYQEMIGRIEETDLSVPVRRGPWWYYHRTIEGRNYPVHCRRPAADGEDPPTDPEPSPDEQVLLDENALAEGHDYFEVGNLAVSPDHRLVAYAVDTTGGELFDLRFSVAPLPGEAAAPGRGPRAEPPTEHVPGTYYGLAWANDNATVFYTRVDAAMRPYQLWRHRLGTDPSADELVLEEADERFNLGVGRTKDDVFVVASLQSTTTSEIWVIPADDAWSAPRLVEPRRQGVEYRLEHHRAGGQRAGGQRAGEPRAGEPAAGGGRRPGGTFVILTNDGAEDFRVMVADDQDPGRAGWREVIGHRPGTRVDDVDVFDRHLVVAERLEGEARLRVVPLAGEEAGAAGPFDADLLATSWLVASEEHPSTTWEGPNPEPSSNLLRFEQSSMVSPVAVADLDLRTATVVVRKRQKVRGGYDPSAYRTFRLWATADDGTRVPISMVHRADLLEPGQAPGTPPVVPAPCVLYGYGAYEHSIDPVFSPFRLSLLDRGVVYAVAHVRGGGELGRRWYEEGRLESKPNSFTDFIACARHLVALGFTAPDRLAARGGSAGGLLIGASINLAPELFRAVVAEVPFVDVLTTMLDQTLPLTVGEWEEWGDPAADPTTYARLKSYSPYDNVPGARVGDGGTEGASEPGGAVGEVGPFPEMLVTAGLHDPRVGFWEPAKWVARIRQTHPGTRVLLRTELGAGHGGPSGRYDAWKEEALVYAFLLDALGVAADTTPPG